MPEKKRHKKAKSVCHISTVDHYRKQVCRNFPVWMVLVYVFLYRAFWYTMQGDFFYVIRGEWYAESCRGDYGLGGCNLNGLGYEKYHVNLNYTVR